MPERYHRQAELVLDVQVTRLACLRLPDGTDPSGPCLREHVMTTGLIALTGAATWTMKDGSTLAAGFWAEELVGPYRILTSAGIEVVLATPGGVRAPVQ